MDDSALKAIWCETEERQANAKQGITTKVVSYR